MENNPAVLIMMASFNGEKYISEQIKSIINQSYRNWKLIIQDDGSKDKTLSIINEYVEKDNRIQVLINDGEHGAYYNFHSLINKCKIFDFDFYMFSDHDDVWHADKIQIMLSFFEANSADDRPMMIYGDMEIIDGEGKKTGKKVNNLLKLEYKSQLDPFYNHTVFGCNCMINRDLFNIVPAVNTENIITSILCHDNYYAKYATVFGRLVYLDRVLMDYRRYGDNVTAKHDYSYGFKKVLRRLSRMDGLAKDHARTYSQSIYTINCMLNSTEGDTQLHLCEIKDSLIQGGWAALKCFIKYKVSCGIRTRTFSRVLILILGIYRKYLVME